MKGQVVGRVSAELEGMVRVIARLRETEEWYVGRGRVACEVRILTGDQEKQRGSKKVSQKVGWMTEVGRVETE